MSTGSAVIVIGGVALAIFIYVRSQAAQAAALAAAQGAPGPGVLQKAENTLKEYGAPLANTTLGPVRGIVSGIGGIFGGGSGPAASSVIAKWKAGARHA